MAILFLGGIMAKYLLLVSALLLALSCQNGAFENENLITNQNLASGLNGVNIVRINVTGGISDAFS